MSRLDDKVAMLTGVVMGMKHAAPVMKNQGGGMILSTASVAGVAAGYRPHMYPAVKAAVVNLARSVAQVLGVDDFSRIDAVYHARR